MTLEQALENYVAAGLLGADDPECECPKCEATRDLRAVLMTRWLPVPEWLSP